MAEQKKDVTRREAIKSIGVIASLPVLGSAAASDPDAHAGMQHGAHKAPPKPAAKAKPAALRFFTAEENRTVIEMSERIIPADASSPGAKAAKVNEYIDLVISESPDEVKRSWRAGLAAVGKMSRDRFGKEFAAASVEQQVELLKEISRNEKSPTTVEERFFRSIKNATIDGYYTSEIGIHQELHYKGNSYLKDFPGCTHPEHKR